MRNNWGSCRVATEKPKWRNGDWDAGFWCWILNQSSIQNGGSFTELCGVLTGCHLSKWVKLLVKFLIFLAKLKTGNFKLVKCFNNNLSNHTFYFWLPVTISLLCVWPRWPYPFPQFDSTLDRLLPDSRTTNSLLSQYLHEQTCNYKSFLCPFDM